MVARSASHCRAHTLEAKLAQSEFIDEYVNDANWTVLAYIVIEMLPEQNPMGAVYALEKTFQQDSQGETQYLYSASLLLLLTQ